MLGLFAFTYATLHFLVWLVFDKGLAWGAMLEDIAERPFITVGFLAFALLIPLAVTSTRGMMRRLGRRWQRLHRAVYVIAILGIIHYIWLVKADILEPAVYAAILAALLLLRLRKPAAGARRAPRAGVDPA
jgi:sulfoxide reductase heme-binding subunit YedZ